MQIRLSRPLISKSLFLTSALFGLSAFGQTQTFVIDPVHNPQFVWSNRQAMQARLANHLPTNIGLKDVAGNTVSFPIVTMAGDAGQDSEVLMISYRGRPCALKVPNMQNFSPTATVTPQTAVNNFASAQQNLQNLHDLAWNANITDRVVPILEMVPGSYTVTPQLSGDVFDLVQNFDATDAKMMRRFTSLMEMNDEFAAFSKIPDVHQFNVMFEDATDHAMIIDGGYQGAKSLGAIPATSAYDRTLVEQILGLDMGGMDRTEMINYLQGTKLAPVAAEVADRVIGTHALRQGLGISELPPGGTTLACSEDLGSTLPSGGGGGGAVGAGIRYAGTALSFAGFAMMYFDVKEELNTYQGTPRASLWRAPDQYKGQEGVKCAEAYNKVGTIHCRRSYNWVLDLIGDKHMVCAYITEAIKISTFKNSDGVMEDGCFIAWYDFHVVLQTDADVQKYNQHIAGQLPITAFDLGTAISSLQSVFSYIIRAGDQSPELVYPPMELN